MGGSTVKQRFFLFIGGIALLILIITAVASSGGSRPHSNPKGTYTCTVDTNFGLQSVKIINQNTGASITKTTSDLPYSFNFTSGDTLQFNATVLKEYTWNAWVFTSSGTFDDHNPLTVNPEEDFTLTANCLIKPAQ
jgi:hypothetical protein